MKQLFHRLFQNPILQAVFFFLLGLVFAFVMTRTVFSPHDETKYNVLADPVTESRD